MSSQRLDKDCKAIKLMQGYIDNMISTRSITTYEGCDKPSVCYNNDGQIKSAFMEYGKNWQQSFGNQYRKYCREKLGRRDVGTVGFATPPAGILRNNGNSSPATGPRVRFGTATEDDGFFSGPGTETASNPSAPRRHTSFSARSPEPVSSATRSKSPKLNKITINTEESDLQDLFVLAPEVIQVMNDRYGIFILHLPFINLDASLLRCIVTNNGRCAKITVGTPAYLLNPERVAGTKLPGKHHIVKQKIYEVLMRRAESADQPIEHNIFLDLPFEAEPTTSSDLFADKTIKGQVSSCVFARVENSNIVLPNQTISTYVLVFKERVNGFAISKKVQSRGVLNLSSDDDESTSNWGGRKA